MSTLEPRDAASRREFVSQLSIGGLVLAANACAPQTTPTTAAAPA
ncbi:MAG: hypothetical protein ACT4P7_05490 [Gemmatimonadaceae bacterium]